MIRLEDHYFNFNKILLLTTGLWPYERSKLVHLRFVLFSGILISSIIFQITVFLTSRCTPDLIIKVLSNAILFSTATAKYILFGIDFKAMKELLEQLQHIYDELKDENETAIIDKYGYDAKRVTIFVTMFGMSGASVLIIIQLSSDIVNITTTNISRPHRFLMITEYFIDQEKYFYLIMLHINITIYLSAITAIAIGTMLISFFHHICGIFKVACYRIEHSMKFNVLKHNNKLNNKMLISEKIICAIDMHRQAMKLSLGLVSRYEVMTSYLTIFGVTSLSLNLFQIFKGATSGDDIREMIPPFIYIIVIISYMFVANYLGQDLTDHNRDIIIAAYNVEWYIAPLYIQRLILFLLRKGCTDFTVNIGGLFIPSLEGFTTLVKTSASYFTVIYSTR
ncbi:hypothetical protein DMN91_006268 [Ooceraea biroi]|uniref:Odorant receptor n=1 Tax=Ooceraea biroi TaxID=2015173 RepID=A0A3L8DNC7_OOCBI|nr:uncharacterized protein LOC105287072 isoform X1 [Ooceraea biroi]XP_026825916.1 uncharacterized protein LOC105287072 isoform X1 [Ooceraea biroi]XP_026825918.1 uncharacterized protein LOC113562062 [Ooceraea biroi]RLU21886.1 hypothetical protein DMN91_006263 [Ooceraea biroi]RLU21891.1 hypothetical protein DMN91_006268 [Ooceraea biroi]